MFCFLNGKRAGPRNQFSHIPKVSLFSFRIQYEILSKSVWSAYYTRCPWSVPSSKTLFHSGNKFSPKDANSFEGVPSMIFCPFALMNSE